MFVAEARASKKGGRKTEGLQNAWYLGNGRLSPTRPIAAMNFLHGLDLQEEPANARIFNTREALEGFGRFSVGNIYLHWWLDKTIWTEVCIFFSGALPEFTNRISNISVPIGRDAVFTCNVKNLGNFKVNNTTKKSEFFSCREALITCLISQGSLESDKRENRQTFLS